MLAQYGGPDDIRTLLQYLKPKPTGATIAEARKTIGGAAVDTRKIAALQAWNVIQVDNGRMTLTAPAREAASDDSKIADMMMTVLREEPAYRGALEWAHFRGASRIDAHELGAYWHEHYAVDLGTNVDKAIARACSAFFRVADGAALGTYVLGRKGSPSRLDLDGPALRGFVDGTPVPPVPIEGDEQIGDSTPLEEVIEEAADTGPDDQRSDEQIVAEALGITSPAPAKDDTLRVFLSHGKNKDLVEQVATILDLAEVPYEIAVDEETTAIPVPEKVLSSMRRCTAGVIIVSVDDAGAATPTVNENVLIETGAAFVLYDRRVILVWDKRLPVPSNLQGLYRCEFEGEELGWSSAVKLMKTLRAFKPGAT